MADSSATESECIVIKTPYQGELCACKREGLMPEGVPCLPDQGRDCSKVLAGVTYIPVKDTFLLPRETPVFGSAREVSLDSPLMTRKAGVDSNGREL